MNVVAVPHGLTSLSQNFFPGTQHGLCQPGSQGEAHGHLDGRRAVYMFMRKCVLECLTDVTIAPRTYTPVITVPLAKQVWNVTIVILQQQGLSTNIVSNYYTA